MLQLRRPQVASDTPRFRAFLSYSHADEAVAMRLHRALETYRLPRHLRAQTEQWGERPLNPIFRDRTDFAADTDLSDAVAAALHDSAALIVLCSPASVTSPWVTQEIELFRATRPGAPILPVIVAGEPFASDDEARAAQECFPAPLRTRVGDHRREPLAADLRPGKDGERLATLKIVAGILHLPLDDLVQRDAERRQRRLIAIAAAAIALAAVLAVSLAFALSARREAERRREQAEGLVEFMVADLGKKLEPVGRLSLMDAVYTRALKYYGEQDAASLEPEALARRARVLQMAGDVRSRQGLFDQAYLNFREAAASTGELLRRSPDDGQRIYDHAQSVFYVGQANWQRGRIREAQSAFEEYRRLALRLIALDPTNDTWRAELGYAESNLGTLLYDRGQTAAAARAFTAALDVAATLATKAPRDKDLQVSLAQAHSWLGDNAAQAGNLARALAEREVEVAIYDRLLATDPGDRQLQEKRITAERLLGVYAVRNSDIQGGLARASAAAADAVALSRTDPQNMEWNGLAALALIGLSNAQMTSGDSASAAASLAHADRRIAQLLTKTGPVRRWERYETEAILASANLALMQGNRALAAQRVAQAVVRIKSAMRSTPEDANLRDQAKRADAIAAHLKEDANSITSTKGG